LFFQGVELENEKQNRFLIKQGAFLKTGISVFERGYYCYGARIKYLCKILL
jgi:hypothetical protein